MRYIIELLIAFSVLTTPFFYAKQYLWGYFFMTVAIVLLGYEIYACLTGPDISLSNRFWVYEATHPKEAHLIILGMISFWIFLCGHLLWKW